RRGVRWGLVEKVALERLDPPDDRGLVRLGPDQAGRRLGGDRRAATTGGQQLDVGRQRSPVRLEPAAFEVFNLLADSVELWIHGDLRARHGSTCGVFHWPVTLATTGVVSRPKVTKASTACTAREPIPMTAPMPPSRMRPISSARACTRRSPVRKSKAPAASSASYSPMLCPASSTGRSPSASAL